jgi:8-oxo-dGTP pyrophosphatase MutT (NUDIX family)
LVNYLGQVLLFRGGDPARPEAGTWWFTPGGGIDDAESAEQAARRELYEETGLQVEGLGPVVLHCQVDHEFEGVHYAQEEEYFLVRCREFDVSDAGWTANERRVVEEHRWWSSEELQATAETVYSHGLVGLLDRLVVR